MNCKHVNKISPIRKPRNWFRNFCHRRHKPFRIGQVVWFSGRYGIQPYRVLSYDDWWYLTSVRHGSSRDYMIYVNLTPMNPHNVWIKPVLSAAAIWGHNKRVEDKGFVGHAVSYEEIFFSYGEVLYTYLCHS